MPSKKHPANPPEFRDKLQLVENPLVRQFTEFGEL